MKPPFKIQPIQPPKQDGHRIKEPGLSLVIQHAISEGETIGESAYEDKAPDHEVANPIPGDVSSKAKDFDHPQRPVYQQPNAFPPIPQVAKKPFKI